MTCDRTDAIDIMGWEVVELRMKNAGIGLLPVIQKLMSELDRSP